MMKQTRYEYSDFFSKNPLHDFLVVYIEKKYKTWQTRFSNIVGVRLDKKEVNSQLTNRYSFVFHVLCKTDDVQQENKIPPYLTIVYNKKRLKIPTDVVQTGKAVLQYLSPGRSVFPVGHKQNMGTIGVVIMNNGYPHLLSNMHVLGWQFLTTTRKVLNYPIDLNREPNIACNVNGTTRPGAYFSSGLIDNRVDAAIALIPQALYQYINIRQDLFSITNPIVLPPKPVKQPIPVKMLGNVSGFKDSAIISTTAVMTFGYPFGDHTLINLIALKPCCCVGGDSGSPVYEPQTRRIIGIMLGKDEDNEHSYVIPFVTILKALKI